VSKAINKAAGVEFDLSPLRTSWFMNAEGAGGYNVTKNQLVRKGESTDSARQWQGWGTALKPALEPITVARKPLTGTVAANVLAHGTGALNIDGCRVGTEGGGTTCNNRDAGGKCLGHKNAGRSTSGETFHGPDTEGGRWPANLIHDGSDEVLTAFPGEEGASAARFFYCAKASKRDRDEGLGGRELVTIAPVAVAKGAKWENADLEVKLLVDTAASPPRVTDVFGAPSSDASAWSTWLFGSERTAPCQSALTCTTETATSSTTGLTTLSYFQKSRTNASTPDASFARTAGGSPAESAVSGTTSITTTSDEMASVLGAARAASATQWRISASAWRSSHPTVKPTDLMRYLCRLVTPPGGVVLDPFMGSGSTGKAALLEGFRFIGCERSPEYVAIARARIAAALQAIAAEIA